MDRISHSTAVDIGGGRRGFRSKDTVAGVPGTVATATHLNATQEELMAVIEAAGLEPAADNLKQILIATRSQTANYRAAGGSANALTFSSIDGFEITQILAGQVFRFLTGANPNTGACTFKVDDIAAGPLVRCGGGALLKDDLPANTAFEAIYIAGSVRLLGLVASDIVAAAAANRSPFNHTQITFDTRVSLSAVGFATYQSGTYTKKSSTSDLVVSMSTNIFSESGTGASFMRMTGLPANFDAIVANLFAGTNHPAANGAKVYHEMAAGDINWALSFGRMDASVWQGWINPNTTDASYLPPATSTSITFEEVEPND